MDTLEFVPVHTPEHFQVVEALANPIWREHYIPLIGSAQVEYMLAKFQTAKAVGQQVREGALYYLIQAPEKENIGFLSVIPRQGELFISKFYLLKEERGKGYARMALEFIKSLAQDLGLERLTLTVNKQNPSVKVYEALGFKILEPVVTDIGEGFVMDDYRMGLDFG